MIGGNFLKIQKIQGDGKVFKKKEVFFGKENISAETSKQTAKD